ncbi:MobF family relaxase [Glutamicibacter sp.]|uniref:MobF family relaxase n=1 Tax=Glutamicibacter sp. TaxID=1931995 RepID=UPI002B4AA1E0|nr:MobF family relaxase [Glutamicibacter sp.]HJX78123.1 MobF family relaxase [Glutamicibacter sp.]
MTLHKLSAGDGYQYYTREVASADELRTADRTLGDYYTVTGHPPGVWGGRGAKNLGVSGAVNEEQMELLYGLGQHPLTGQIDPQTGAKIEAKLGQRYKRFDQFDAVLTKKITTAMGDFTRLKHREPTADERRIIRSKAGGQHFYELHGRKPKDKEELSQFISRQTHKGSNAVAGYDMVFSPSKSISYLWGVSDRKVQGVIEKAHHAAIEDAMQYLETNATFTRRGKNGVRSEDVDGGLIYTSFRHYDSRDGDPQLHDHIVVSNKVLGMDGKWSALDGTVLHKYAVSASEHYNAKVMQYVCKELGASPASRAVEGKRPIIEIGGVPMAAIEASSSRRSNIKENLTQLVAGFEERHGRAPNTKQLIKFSQQATLETREVKKKGRSLSELTGHWQSKFSTTEGALVGDDLFAAVRAYSKAQNPNYDLVEALPAEQIEALAQSTISRLEQNRSTWTTAHVEAEVRRQITQKYQAQPIADSVIVQIRGSALDSLSLKVTPELPVPTAVPGAVMSVYRYQKPHAALYTSEAILEAEHTAVQAACTDVIPAVTREEFTRVLENFEGRLNDQQVALAQEFSCSPKLLVAGIGPAGTGKTTSMRLAVTAMQHSGHHVVAVAPSAKAASLLGSEVGAEALTVDRLLRTPDKLNPGDIVLVDEAGMLGTPQFVTLILQAKKRGALVRAIGDDKQLSAVGAGGLLRLLNAEEQLVNLEEIHRFRNTDGTPNLEEAAASLALREAPAVGKDDPWAYYRAEGKIQAGTVDHMADQVFAAWQKDTNKGLKSLMLAGTNTQVDRLNQKAQAYRLHTGQLDDAQSLMGRNNAQIFVGDVILTKNNDRRISVHQGKDFVKNNDAWVVEGIEDGNLLARHQQHQGLAVIPATYAEQHVILGYADTVHTAQGATVDTAHALLTNQSDRAGAYVATSRGKYDNQIYVGLAENERPDEVLKDIAGRTDLNITAHESITREHNKARDLSGLGEIYRDLADQARDSRFEQIFRTVVGDRVADSFVADPAWGAVTHHLQNAEKQGIKMETLLADAYHQREFANADQPAAVLAWRMEPLLENRAEALASEHRPLRDVATKHLEELERRATAQAEILAVPYRETATQLATNEGLSPYTRRLYGHLTDDALANRVKTTGDDLLRQVPSDPENNEKLLSWSLDKLREEQQRREDMPELLRQAETLDRGHELHSTAAGTIVERISRELELRELEQPTLEPAHVRSELGEWYAPTAELHDPRTSDAWKQQLAGYRQVLDTERQRVGADLAQNPPVWLDALGPVPGRSDRAEEWRRVAAEVAAYRRTYNIADSEPALLPKTHLKKSEVAQNLRNRAAALHKHSELTTRAPMPEEAKTEMIQQKNDQAFTTLNPTNAEAKLAQLRRLSQGGIQPTSEQENIVPAEPEHEMSGQKPTPAAESLLEKLRRNRTELQDEQKSHAQDDELRRKGPGGLTIT